MTSYQNVAESEIQGYNDCPVLDLPTSTSSGPKTRRPRPTAHNLSGTSLNTIPSTTSVTGLNNPSSGPNSRPSLSKTPSIVSLKQRAVSSSSVPDAPEVTDDELSTAITQLLSLENTLPEREFDHYSKKLQDGIPKMKPQHKGFVVANINNYENKEEVKKNVVRFMMSNDGTSTWCMPLRKILENVKL